MPNCILKLKAIQFKEAQFAIPKIKWGVLLGCKQKTADAFAQYAYCILHHTCGHPTFHFNKK